MLLRQLFDANSSSYTYLLAADYKSPAIIIDPVKEHLSLYLKLIDDFELQLLYSIETHVHADHITASGALAKQTGCHILTGEQTAMQGVDRRVTDGEFITIGEIHLHAIYTPGHTNDSYCFRYQQHLFTGDTLFIRGTGRTDFQHGDAGQQYDSLFDKLLTLPDETWVYPAHDYQGMTVSTIGEEKRFNSRLQVANKADYVALMAGLNLPRPKLMDVAVPANVQRGL